MNGRTRLLRNAGRYALVDGIPFKAPVSSERTRALMAAFPIDLEQARRLLPGHEVHPLRVWNRGLLVITVVDYQQTVIGSYIEYSIAIACTHGTRPAPRLLPALFSRHFRTGQFVIDLPVSTEISVKGGKGIWGMPKHQANLDFKVDARAASAQYDLDGQLCTRLEIDIPGRAWLPIRVGAANYCAFRGMLFKSYIYFSGRLAPAFLSGARARLDIGDHPRVQALKTLEIDPKPLFTGFIPEATGMLDDYFEAWFLSHASAPVAPMEGLESVVGLGLGQDWLEPPRAPIPARKEGG